MTQITSSPAGQIWTRPITTPTLLTPPHYYATYPGSHVAQVVLELWEDMSDKHGLQLTGVLLLLQSKHINTQTS